MRRGSSFSLMAVTMCFMLATSLAEAGDFVTVEKSGLDAQPTDNQALVVVVRPVLMAKVVKFWAFADDQPIGATKGRTFTYALVDAGAHVFWTKAGNVSAFELEVEAGKTYFLEQCTLLGGLKARVRFEPVDEDDGMKAVSECKLATLTPAGVQRAKEIAADELDKAKKKAAKRAQR